MAGGIALISQSKSRSLLAFCFCFILGVGSVSFIGRESEIGFYFYILLFVAFFVLIVFWSGMRARFICFCFLFFILGAIRFLLSIPGDNPGQISFYNGKQIIFLSSVKDVLPTNTGVVHYVVRAGELFLDGGTKVVHGLVLVDDIFYSDYIYGDKLKITCNLKNPAEMVSGDFRYDRYLARLGVWSVCSRAEIDKIQTRFSVIDKIIRSFVGWRGEVQHQAQKLWTEPKSSLMSGILYGARSGLPKDLLENFNRVGLTHIIAISGYNISVVAAALLGVLIYSGINRRQAFWIVTGGIILFVLFSGASASVVRAGIMGIIVLLAGFAGRSSRVGNILVITAAIMLLLNPFILIWDAGFQLSFIATLGLVYLSPLFSAWPEILAVTFSAIIATLPLILFQFGRLSLVAPVVNILVLWLIPFLMLFGFLAIVFSFIFYPLGMVLSLLAMAGMQYLLFIIEWFGSKSWSSVMFFIPWWVAVLSYVCLIFLVIKKRPSVRQIFDVRSSKE